MAKRIKVKFIGFPPYHDPHDQWYYRFLCDRYEVEECDDPDFLIDGGQNLSHVFYDCVKILISSENNTPNFDMYDYAIASCHMEFGDRYLRVPWFAFYPDFATMPCRITMSPEELLNRKFCSFVVSNAEFGDPIRRIFFEKLSQYKQVDSGGLWRNNVGGPVKDKLAFCRGYKFNIAFENSSFDGYTTEKIKDAYVAQTVPIYYGNPSIEKDFKSESMVRVAGVDDIDRAIDEIKRLDGDDAAYLKMVTADCAVESAAEYHRRVEAFLSQIFDREPAAGRRICQYGQQQVYRRHLKMVLGFDYKICQSKLYRFAVGLRGKMRRAKA